MGLNLRTRAQRGLGPRPRTLKTRQLIAETKREAEPLFDHTLDVGKWPDGEGHPVQLKRPRTRGECVNSPRPCPWVSCRHNLFIDVKVSPDGQGLLRYNFPEAELEDLRATCSLDVADEGRHTLEQVGDLVNLTREQVHHIVTDALGRVRLILAEED